MYPVIFHLGPITLHTYGLLVALGFLAGYTVARSGFMDRRIPLPLLDQLIVYVMLSGLLGARLLYFVLNEPGTLREHPLEFFKIWEGGLVFYGGLAAGVLVVLVFSRIKDIRFLTLTDGLVPPLLLAHAIGRLGCFAAGCCYGKQTASFLGVRFMDPDSLAPRFVAVHPIQIYESLAAFALFFLVLWVDRKKPTVGALTSLYLISYSVVRFLTEFLRGDDRGATFAGFSPAQMISLVTLVIGILVWAHVRKERHV